MVYSKGPSPKVKRLENGWKTYLLGRFDSNNVDAVVHEVDQLWLQGMTAGIVEDTPTAEAEAISVNVFIFIGLGKHEAGQPSKAA